MNDFIPAGGTTLEICMDGITPDYCDSASITIGGSPCNVQTCDDNNCIQCITTAVSTFV